MLKLAIFTLGVYAALGLALLTYEVITQNRGSLTGYLQEAFPEAIITHWTKAPLSLATMFGVSMTLWPLAITGRNL